MGEISILTKEQKIILDGIKQNDFLLDRFYFTGGTALSEYYLNHRYSEDLDFFTEKPFDSELTLSFISTLQKKHRFIFTSEQIEAVQMFFIQFSNKEKVKIDFNFYLYKRLVKSKLINGIYVDSLLDIAVNKLLTVTQREDVKHFVDLYFLEPKFGIWDLIQGVRTKFKMEVEPWLLSSDLLKVDEFTFLPKMIKPLKIQTLKLFFRKLAQDLGKKAVE